MTFKHQSFRFMIGLKILCEKCYLIAKILHGPALNSNSARFKENRIRERNSRSRMAGVNEAA